MNVKSNIRSNFDFERKYIFLDNDFLKIFSTDERFFKRIKNLLSNGFLMIDDLVKLEFLRDIYVPQQKKAKEDFIFNNEIFSPVILYQEIFTALKNNALLLSKIYRHQIQKTRKNSACSASPIDLMQAARLMLNYERCLLITGNKKDFPSSIFNIVSIIPYETKPGNIKPFCIIRFNKKKFDQCYKELQTIENKNP